MTEIVVTGMKLAEMIKSKEFLEAKSNVSGWRARLEKADSKEAIRVRDEKSAFFSKMRSSRPDLYTAFQVSDKELSERIFKILTGKDVVID